MTPKNICIGNNPKSTYKEIRDTKITASFFFLLKITASCYLTKVNKRITSNKLELNLCQLIIMDNTTRYYKEQYSL